MPEPINDLLVLSEMLNDSFQVTYADYLNRKSNWSNQLILPAPCRNRKIHFPFIYDGADLDIVNEGDPPAYNTLLGQDVSIALKAVKGGVSIRQIDFEDPMYQNQLFAQVKGLGIKAAYHNNRRLVNALINGDTDTYYTMYDGELLFSNSHSIGGYSFDNLGAGTLSATSFAEAKTKLRQIPWGSKGEYLPMEGSTFYLVVPPQLSYTAKALMKNTWDPADNKYTENILRGEAEVIVDEQLGDDADDWYLIAELPDMKPFVNVYHQTLNSMNLVPEVDPSSDAVKNHDEYRWSLKMFRETFPTHFWLMIKYVN